MSNCILDAQGRPFSSGNVDPRDLRIGELERQLTDALTANNRLQAKIREDQVEMLVATAIAENRASIVLRPYLMHLGRLDFERLQAFVAAMPPLPALNDSRAPR